MDFNDMSIERKREILIEMIRENERMLEAHIIIKSNVSVISYYQNTIRNLLIAKRYLNDQLRKKECS